MTKDAEAIQELMEAERLATPGPWSSSGVTIADNGPCHTKVAITWRRSWKTGKGTEAGVRNAAFIAAARNAVPTLLNLIRERGLGHREDCPLYQAVYAESSGGWFRVRDALPSATLEWLGESLACICRTDETVEALNG